MTTDLDIIPLEITLSDNESFVQLQASLIEDYAKRPEGEDDDEWLSRTLQTHLPAMDMEDVTAFVSESQEAIEQGEAQRESATQAMADGENLQHWFERTMEDTAKIIGPNELVMRLEQVDSALIEGNAQMLDALTTRGGGINQCPNLDGFIAEQQHVATFNARATLENSQYRARVRMPKPGQLYAKNSVDIEIYHTDDASHALRKYQVKYGADSKTTAKHMQKGDYRGQRKLVPEGHADTIPGATDRIESPDGKITSKPFSKAEAKASQERIQRGEQVKVGWDSLQTKRLLKEIGSQAGIAALLAAGLTAGVEIGTHLLTGEPIDFGAVLMNAGKAGLGVGLVTACIAGLKIAIERGWISLIPPGTPVHIIATVVQVAVANAKTLWSMIKGEISVMDGLKAMEMTTVTMVCGLVCAAKGAAIGATIGTALGPIGTFVGGLVGGIIGYFAGSKVGEFAVNIRRKISSFIASRIEHTREVFAKQYADGHPLLAM